ncbi:MAG TPA: hypothetical protein VFE58_02820 [Tepidisphaeraceae bacterium]|jgi:hypothetical protein|nr:hypothetical protein [Tepidisphaeraceae bacterium]
MDIFEDWEKKVNITRVFKCGPAVALGLLAQGAFASSIVGYSGDKSDDAYVDGVQVTMTAGDARSQFLGALSGYYYEDFQEVSASAASKSFSKLGISNYSFQWKSPTLNTASAPAGTLTTGDASNTFFRLGQVGSARGAFDTYDNSLASATGGSLLDSQNSYLDITPGKTDYDVTINITPGMNAVGLMLNDVLQPNKIAVLVTFLNGTTVDATDQLQGFAKNARTGVLTPTGLSNNNDFFLGIVGSTPISSITIDETANGTPICLDNIYAGNVANFTPFIPAVPLPSSVIGGTSLLGLLAVLRRRAQQA